MHGAVICGFEGISSGFDGINWGSLSLYLAFVFCRFLVKVAGRTLEFSSYV